MKTKFIKTREERNRETTNQLEMNHFCWSQWYKTRNRITRRKLEKNTYMWRLNNMIVNSQQINEENKK